MSNRADKIKHGIFHLISHRLVVFSLVFAFAFLCIAASVSSVNTFVIHEGENVTIHNSSKVNTNEILSEAGIVIDETKYVEMPEKAEHGVAEIYIYPKKKVELKIGENSSFLYTEKEVTVSELLIENDIQLGKDDIISVSPDSIITDGIQIEITRVSHSTQEVCVEIPFTTTKRASASRNKGTSVTIQAGINGSKKVIYDVEIRNGKEYNRTVLSETIITEPVTKIVEYGTKPVDTSGVFTTKSGEKLKYKKKLSMTATAYTTERTSDKITATGQVARVGLVAVDRKVIPLGSKLYIISADGKSWCYGKAVAGDTGVKGNKIDLFFNTYNECISFGRRKATVYVLE